jgi:hypothetical protein
MDRAESSRLDGDDHRPGWVDVTTAPLSWLFWTDDTILARCVREVLAELDQPAQILAAFGNSPSPR